MIYDTLAHIEEYRGLSTQMDLALEILKNTDFLSVDPGKYIINDDVYYNVLEAQTRDFAEAKWECHRKYIDIQYALSADEQIAYCP